jgi:ribosomal protein L24E
MILRPSCLYCGKKPAKVLFVHGDPLETYFCTKKCAAAYGVREAAVTQEWCNEHRHWHHADEGCEECNRN